MTQAAAAMSRSNVKIVAFLTGIILLAVFLIYLAFKTLPISAGPSGARTTPATESIQGQYIGLAQLVDAGNTTPEAALESAFWAMVNGNSSIKGLQILARKTVADDKVELRYHIDHTDSWNRLHGETTTNNFDQILLLVKKGGAWKFAHKTAYTTNWDEGSKPEPQP
jgi:hypothetical protein